MNRTVRPAAQEQRKLEEKDLCKDAGRNAVRVKIVEVDSDDSGSSDEEATEITHRRVAPLE